MTLFLLCTGCVGREFIDGVDACCTCHSVFIDHFKVYSYSVLAADLWISRDIAFLTIPCVGHDSIFAFHLMCRSWIHWRCRFHVVPVTQYSLTISRSSVTLFLQAIYGSAVTYCFFHFHASAMTLFLLSTWCLHHEFIDAVNSMLYLSLIFHWRFQGLRLLCFGRRFMDQPWHSIFDNSMRRPWLYFFYRFDVSVENSLTLSIPCGRCHSVFIDDFKVYCYSVFGRWFMEQPWDSVFYISMRRPWLYFCYLLDASVVNSLTMSIPCCTCHSVFIDDFKVYGHFVLAADLWISRDVAFLTIPCVGHDSIFSIDLMRRSWVHWRCRFHAIAVTQYSLTISRSTVTLLWPVTYGSAVTKCFFHFHASAMTLFLLSTWCFRREFIDAVDSMLYLSLSIHWRFQGLLLLSFCRRFMDLPWQNVFFSSMRLPWLYFCYLLDASVVNSLTLSIPCCTCHSVFIDDFKVYCYSLFAGDLWITHDIAFLTIPCISHDSSFFYRFDVSVVNSLTLSIPCGSCHSVFIDDFKVYCYSVLAGDLWSNCEIAFFTIACGDHDYIFSIDFMRR
jgi:hypothetical protein